jgi:cellobiose-specific phosphotransferase system component IIA
MMTKKLVVSLAVLGLIWCSFGQAKDIETSGAAKVKAAAQDVMKVSKDGFAALRAIRGARIAIFNGEPKEAEELLTKAQKDLDAASESQSAFLTELKKIVGDKNSPSAMKAATSADNDWIPIDGQIALADTYVPSPENRERIAKANEHLKAGRSKEAVEELRLGRIDVSFTRLMMPLGITKQCVADAIRLTEEQKYYEANLALKAAEDALVVDSVSLSGTPEYKSAPKATPEASSSGAKTEKKVD